MKPRTHRPWWLGIIVVAIGGLWLYQSTGLPQLGGYAALGPGFFVSVIGVALIVLGGVLLIQIALGESFEAQDSEDAQAGARASWPSLLLAAAGAGIPLLTMEWLGFPLTAMLAFALVTRAFGSRRVVMDCLIGLVIGAVCWLGFSRLGVSLGGVLPLAGW